MKKIAILSYDYDFLIIVRKRQILVCNLDFCEVICV